MDKKHVVKDLLKFTKTLLLIFPLMLIDMNVMVNAMMDGDGTIKDIVVMAFDLETSGPNFVNNGILSIGVSVQTTDMKEIASFQRNLKLESGMSFDKTCWEQFWSKQPAVYKFVTTDAVEPRVAMEELVKFITDIETKYPQCFIVCDNPSFDIAWLNAYISRYTARLPINYHTSGKYRMVWDLASVQKALLGLQHKVTFSALPPKHNSVLGFNAPYAHDHTPLNDARIIANFFLQTWARIEHFDASSGLKPACVSKPIVICPYDEGWSAFFDEEAARIRSALGENLVSINHIGSTSVPGLSAKPIVDIIVEVNDLEKAKLLLTGSTLGYRYKGEFNLPFRDLYGKKGKYDVNLHVHRKGSAEVNLNLLFRDFLRTHSDIRAQYEKIKIDSSHSAEANERAETGITKYNLMKNDIIVSILQKTGFDGLCVRFPSQHTENEAFDKLKSDFLSRMGLSDIPASTDIKKFVLYKGTNIVGAAELSDLGLGRFSINFIMSNTKDEFLQLLHVVEEWAIMRKNAHSLLAVALPEQCEFYMSDGFTTLPCKDGSKKLEMYKEAL